MQSGENSGGRETIGTESSSRCVFISPLFSNRLELMKHRILIIEDQEEIALVLQDFLEEEGLSVQVAMTGKEALEKIRKYQFDVLLTDFKLPDLDGLAVLREGKKISPKIKTIFVTGYKMQIEDLAKEPELDYQIIEKPCRPIKILEAINSAL